jgi:hypothetical protein
MSTNFLNLLNNKLYTLWSGKEPVFGKSGVPLGYLVLKKNASGNNYLAWGGFYKGWGPPQAGQVATLYIYNGGKKAYFNLFPDLGIQWINLSYVAATATAPPKPVTTTPPATVTTTVTTATTPAPPPPPVVNDETGETGGLPVPILAAATVVAVLLLARRN